MSAGCCPSTMLTEIQASRRRLFLHQVMSHLTLPMNFFLKYFNDFYFSIIFGYRNSSISTVPHSDPVTHSYTFFFSRHPQSCMIHHKWTLPGNLMSRSPRRVSGKVRRVRAGHALAWQCWQKNPFQCLFFLIIIIVLSGSKMVF